MLAITIATVPALAQDANDRFEFRIEGGSLGQVVEEVHALTDIEFLYSFELVSVGGLKPVKGRYTVDEALAIALQGTGLSGGLTNGGMIVITRDNSANAQHREIEMAGGRVKKGLLAGIATFMFGVGANAQDVEAVDEVGSESEPEVVLDEIVVTGSNIRGVDNSSSPVIFLDRDYIDRSGFSTAQQLLEVLPQNFGGDVSEDNPLSNSRGANISGGAGINLRGLGNTSTLILVNGRRLNLAGGFNGGFVDVSNLPLSAIERVEVLPDGASAIYGSDAVAGVVNFIVRDDYDGADTNLRNGTAGGDFDEFQFSQTLGRNWEGGGILASYEYYQRGNLDSANRDFAATDDLTAFGGTDFRRDFAAPGTIQLVGLPPAPFVAAIPDNQDGTALTPGDFIVGQRNLANGREGLDLLGEQERYSLYLSFNQELTDRVRFFADASLYRRDFDQSRGAPTLFNQQVTDANPFFVSPDGTSTVAFLNYSLVNELGFARFDSESEGFFVASGATVDLSQTWQAEVYASYAEDSISTDTLNGANILRVNEALGNNLTSPAPDAFPGYDPTVDGFLNLFSSNGNNAQAVIDFIRGGSLVEVDGKLTSLSAKADGQIFAMPGGAAKLAVGADFRSEGIGRRIVDDTTSVVPTESDRTALDADRDVFGAFTEVLLPFFGEQNARPGLQRLELSVAARVEDYSDFGTSTNPKVGALWSPSAGLFFRGTYGTSFRAPRLSDISGNRVVETAAPLPNDMGGTTVAVVRFGINPELEPEEATTWTAGFKYEPLGVEGLGIDITYYNVEFEKRIVSVNAFGALLQPDIFAPIINSSPNVVEVQELLDSPFYQGSPFITADSVEAIIDGRLGNFASTKTDGLDFAVRYSHEIGSGRASYGLTGNYIFSFDEAITETSPVVERLNTLSNPVDLRLRGSFGWANDHWSLSAFVNYIDSYEDNVSSPARGIDSWTTVDLSAAYLFSPEQGLLNDLTVALSAQNIFDEDPPFANNGTQGTAIGYDPQNASPIGRFMALELRKSW